MKYINFLHNWAKPFKLNNPYNYSMIVFGPFPSRRLGQSLGINNIPPKICTYSCIYCQLGRTRDMQIERKEFYKPESIMESVEGHVRNAKEKGEPIDYLTFVPDGEPTLDINLGKEIELLKKIGIKIAVISNASLMWMEDVQNNLLNADWVSLKIDAMTTKIWRKIDRPHGALELNKILDSIIDFSDSFNGKLVTETMLVKGVNDDIEEINKISDFISNLDPDKAYISIPTRPPAENWVSPPSEESINIAYQNYIEKSIDVEYLIGYEGNDFGFTGDVEEDLLSITSVHPMRKDAVEELLIKADRTWDVADKLINNGLLVEMEYGGEKFYMRNLRPLT